jgi:sterol desaturase/sphingolipid hydroxylase (fatty acid hydroxylase superfamily)
MPLSIESVRRLGSSRFNYWFGYVANAGLVLWLISHGLWGPTAVRPLGFVGYAMAGLLTWTFLEYVLHRYVYHEVKSFLSVGHGLHHDAPKELIGVPWYLTSAIVVALYGAVTQVFAPGATGLVMGFAWLGYMGYCLLHHGSHHWRFEQPYFRAMKRHHLVHHAFPEFNWGFTTSLWDRAFGTYKAPRA